MLGEKTVSVGISRNQGVARLTPKTLNLSDGEPEQLQQLINRHNTPQQIALRAKIILMASDGQNHREIARSLDINRQTARLYRILNFLDYFNQTMAKPFKWTYKGKFLVI